MNLMSGRRLALYSIVCLILVYTNSVFAGDDPWRPVTPAELAMKTSQVEPGGDAEAIFWEVRIDDSSSSDLSKQHYVRVKIFTERGREKFSKFDIPYTKRIKIKDISARVIRPDGSIVEIQKTDIFDREIIKLNKVKFKAKSFAIPNIEPGVIVEYRYREVFEDSGAVGLELQFQRDIPVQNLSYYYRPYEKKEPKYQSYNFTDTKFVKDEKGFYLAKRTNVPAFKEEPYMPPENNVRAWMILQGVGINVVRADVSAFGTSLAFSVKDPSNPSRYWGSVAGEHVQFVELMNKKDKEISKAAQQAVGSASTDDDKLRKLYEFCQSQIRNSTFDVSMTDDEKAKLPSVNKIADVLKNKVARGMYIDMLFGALANSLGFESRVALASDRSEIFFSPDMTNEDFVHPAAIAVKVGDRWKFFNPGVSFLPYGSLLWYEEDVWTLLVGEKFNNWEKTPMTDEKTSKTMRSAKFKLADDGTLEGTVKVEYAGQLAIDYRMNNYDESAAKREDDLKKEITQRLSTAEVSDLLIENVSDITQPVTHQYKVRVPNYAQRTGKRLFVQPGFFEFGESPTFSSENRTYDVYFNFPWSEEDAIEIQLPKGFSLDNADAPNVLADQQKISLLDIDLKIDRSTNTLIYHRNFFFGGGGYTLFPVKAYSAVKSLFDEIQKADSHTITLKQD